MVCEFEHLQKDSRVDGLCLQILHPFCDEIIHQALFFGRLLRLEEFYRK